MRFVCSQIQEEVDGFCEFTVTFRKPLTRMFTPIPFANLKFLTVDNCNEDLPWYYDQPLSPDSQDSDPNARHFEGSIAALKLMSVSQATLQRLAYCRTIKGVIIATDVFERKIPQLRWVNLTYLRIHFYIVRFVGSRELEMLENFDTLCSQTFPNLTSLKICLRRSYLNPQSSFSIRALRFMAKHWRTLREMNIEMEAEKCDLYPQTIASEFSSEELENLWKVQLNSLKIDATELLCRKCRIWQEFIAHQKSLDSLKVSIYSAEGHPNFFYPIRRNPNRESMTTVSIGLWGLHSRYPVDFQKLTAGVPTIYNIRFFRSPSTSTANNTSDGPELLNINYIPHSLVSLTLKGFVIAADDVDILLDCTPNLTHLTLKNAGSTATTGAHVRHIPLLQHHPNLATACVDFVNPVNCTDQSFEIFIRELERGRLEYKVTSSRDGFHTFLFIDRLRTALLLRKKCKLHDDEVLPGLDYPTGFINRFDNWKIRN